MRVTSAVVLMCMVALGLAGCGPSPVSKAQTSCMFEIKPKGSYVSENDGPLKAGDGANQAEADALNSCVERRLGAGKTTGAPITALNAAATPATPAPSQIVRQTSWTSGSPATTTLSTGAVAPSNAARPQPTTAAPAPLRNGSCAMTGGAGYVCK